MAVAWPGSVNQLVYRNGYSQSPERNVATFQPQVGPPIQRRRSSISTDVVTCVGRGTPTEWAALEAFYRNTLHDGVDQFTRNDPLTGAANRLCIFTAAPKITSILVINVVWSLAFRMF